MSFILFHNLRSSLHELKLSPFSIRKLSDIFGHWVTNRVSRRIEIFELKIINLFVKILEVEYITAIQFRFSLN